MNIPTLNKFTPSVDYEIKTGWGTQTLNSLEKDTGLSIKDLIKRAKFLGVNGGKEKNMSIEDMNKLSNLLIAKCCISEIIKQFPDKKISSIYLAIRGVQDLSEADKYQGVAQNFLAEGWTDEEKGIIFDYIMNPDKSRQSREALNRKFPLRTRNAIAQRLNVTIAKLKKQGVIIPSTPRKSKKSDFMIIGEKIKVNEKAIPKAKEIVEEACEISNPKPEVFLTFKEEEPNETPLQSIKKDIIKLIDEMHSSALESTRRYKTEDLYIKVDLWRKQD